VVRLDPALDEVGVLLEPATVLAKAWDHIQRIGRRAHWAPSRVLVIGAGPVGLMAALLSVHLGLETHVLDQVTEGLKPELVAAIGGTYHAGTVEEAAAGADIIVECTGVAQLALQAMCHNAPDGIVCLTGVSSGGRDFNIDAGELNRRMVLENDVILGSVNANRHHYQLAAAALARADPGWLARLITRRVPVDRWQDAYVRQPGDVKTVVEFAR
jgi:threonine dehydrogenase-like Zn-dependent dehydrogenase